MSLLLLAFVVRFQLLDAQSLWNDEGNSYVQATRALTEIPVHAARDIHPPGYYWLLHLWRIFTGDTEFALRSLSAFGSVLAVAFSFALGRRLYGAAAGLSAALFVTLNTFQIHYAQEARMYALLALWGVAGMWALVRFLTSPPPEKTRWALALALINTAGLWTQYAYPFVMLAQGMVFVVWWVERVAAAARTQASPPPGQTQESVGSQAAEVPLRDAAGFGTSALSLYALANLLTLVLYLPWLPTAWNSLTTWPSTGQPAPLSEMLGVIVGWFTLGMTASVTDASWVAVGMFLLLFGLRVAHPVRSLWRLILPVAWAALPVGLFLALGLFREGNLKLLLPAQIGFALWLGRGVWALWETPHRRGGVQQHGSRVRWLFRAAALIAVLGLGVNLWRGLEPLYHHPAFQRDDYRRIVSDITADLRPGDAIILDAPNQEEVFDYYYAGDAPVYPLPPGLGGNDAETQAAVEQIIANHERMFVVFWGEAERDPNRVVETTLSTQAFEADSQWYGDVRLVRYASPVEPAIAHTGSAQFGQAITLEGYTLSSPTVRPGDVLQVRLDWRTDTKLDTRYKVFVQLLDEEGRLAAQRDSEPGSGLALTTTWQPGAVIKDHHALIIPDNLSPANYTLIIGLYDADDPQQRLQVGDADHLILSRIVVE
ncbi:MAG TPA: glycosyltransferase family 39 protein [Spirillospora sp.]|nr:glycosyltransferase family 39 protein [Spirillospora sp.]